MENNKLNQLAKLLEELYREMGPRQIVPEKVWVPLHHAGLPAAAADMAITDGKGKFLLVKRTDGQFKGWEMIGGYFRRGDKSVEAACKRIAKRDGGVAVKFICVIDVYKWPDGEHPYGAPISVVCLCKLTGRVKETKNKKLFRALPKNIVTNHRRFMKEAMKAV